MSKKRGASLIRGFPRICPHTRTKKGRGDPPKSTASQVPLGVGTIRWPRTRKTFVCSTERAHSIWHFRHEWQEYIYIFNIFQTRSAECSLNQAANFSIAYKT